MGYTVRPIERPRTASVATGEPGSGGPSGLPVFGSPVETIAIARLDLSGSPRLSGVDEGHLAVLRGIEAELLPPVLVHGATLRVIDGVHRVHAAISRGESVVRAVLVEASQDELFIRAVRANAAHGLPLSLAERKAAVRRILGSHPQWSNRMIAGIVGISPKTVGSARQQLEQGRQLSHSPRVGLDGRTYRADRGNARDEAAAILACDPTISVRALARSLGVSVGSAHNARRAYVEERSQGASGGDEGLARAPESRGTVHRDHAAAQAAAPSVNGDQWPAMLVRSLAGDPSLRQNAQGRALLRMLLLHAVGTEEWAQLAAAVPEHRTDTVTALAESLAYTWQRFADDLRSRRPPRGAA